MTMSKPRRSSSGTNATLLALTCAIATVASAQAGGDDSKPVVTPEVYIPAAYTAVSPVRKGRGKRVKTVHFTPQDENTSVTVLLLYNVGKKPANVGIETYQSDGSVFTSAEVAVPASGLVRIATDPVETVSATWQDTVVINFTTFSTYAKMTLPRGVRAEGFVVWNGGATYDPLQVAPTLPLRFTTVRAPTGG
jgi:hypothetical protein